MAKYLVGFWNCKNKTHKNWRKFSILSINGGISLQRFVKQPIGHENKEISQEDLKIFSDAVHNHGDYIPESAISLQPEIAIPWLGPIWMQTYILPWLSKIPGSIPATMPGISRI